MELNIKKTIVNETNVLTYKEKVLLQHNVKLLKENEFMEILRILINNNIKYTENNNGIFVNMTKLSQKTIEDIESFLTFIKNNNF